MKHQLHNSASARLVRVGAGLLGLVTLGWIMIGHADEPDPIGMPTDWSHQHLIFSRPATSAQEDRVAVDPRYWQQWARRNVPRVVSEDGSLRPDGISPELGGSVARQRPKVHRDWSENLGNGASVGVGNYPAKYSFQIKTANCGSATKPDYVVFATGVAGTASQPSIVAFDNLYSGCGGIVPTVYWSLNTGGQVLTSPVISGDGSQVAFVQTKGGFGILVLLKWAAGSGTLGSPTTLTAVSNASYRSCTAPCMTEVFLKTSSGTQTDDTTSSPFPDYSDDVIWVGGAQGWLHKIAGVFRGTPAEVTTGGFPKQVNNGNALSSPVWDFASGNIYVGDYGGFLYRVSSTGTVTPSAQVDHGTGVVAAPIVDATAGKVWVFSSNDASTSCAGSSPCAAVYEFTTSFGSGTSGLKALVGASVNFPLTPSPLYEGGFDSTYAASTNATGNLYVCGNTGGAPTLYRVPISAGTMGAVVTGPVLSSATTGCAPVTDISNPNATGGTTEWLFTGVHASGLKSSCAAGGCIMNFVNTPWLASHAYNNGQEVLDTHFQIQAASNTIAGTSGAGTPTWNTTVGGSTTDGTVSWVNQGPIQLSMASWTKNTAYAKGTEVTDSNNNVEIAIKAGTSNATPPAWSTVVGATVIETGGGPHWENMGAFPSYGLSAAGGPSGIIMDNTVGSGTLAGASEVYFSTQSNQTCATSGGTGGCATQATQAKLQ